ARPKVTSRYYSREDVRKNRPNILFFGNFVNMPLEEYAAGMHELMEDWDKLYGSMISDLYSLGHVLKRKYRLLWFSYSSFMLGLIVTIVMFFVLYFGRGLTGGDEVLVSGWRLPRKVAYRSRSAPERSVQALGKSEFSE